MKERLEGGSDWRVGVGVVPREGVVTPARSCPGWERGVGIQEISEV